MNNYSAAQLCEIAYMKAELKYKVEQLGLKVFEDYCVITFISGEGLMSNPVLCITKAGEWHLDTNYENFRSLDSLTKRRLFAIASKIVMDRRKL